MEPRTAYPSDFTEREWGVLQHVIPSAKPGGQPEKYPKRALLNALASGARTGCAWRWLPQDFPSCPIVYHDFRRWRDDGTWGHMHEVLHGDMRAAAGKHWQPRAGILDSQTVKPTETGGPRVRCRQTRQRPQAPPPRGYPRVAPHRRRHCRQCARPWLRPAAPGDPPPPVLPPAGDRGRSGLCWGPGSLALGATAVAQNPPGNCESARGHQGVPALAQVLGGGTDLRLVWPLLPLSQG